MMNDKCDICDELATVHETVIEHSAKNHRNLCESHAREAGLIPLLGQIYCSYASKHSLNELKSLIYSKVGRFSRQKLGWLGMTSDKLRAQIRDAVSVDDVIKALGES